MKKIILIWDFDGPIGQINSSYPYNFHFENLEAEIHNVKWLLNELKDRGIQCCFAITGFSAETGVYPYNFPEFINEISKQGHEVASHSWRHEWGPIFKKDQVNKSLKRSKMILEKALENRQNVSGFVPPHNRPMTWWQRGAFSMGDRGIFPFFTMGNTENLLRLLMKNDYQWIRVSYKNLFTKLGFIKRNMTGRVFRYKGVLVFENHYTGFDNTVVQHILSTNYETYTISAHPFMLGLPNKNESRENFMYFLNELTKSDQKIEFVLPSSLL
ncbi:MAG TPA: polysaccharide deacetylase family protein [Flavobacterium sp.]|nr:polysaccharide deacetylase family protein [Flavobacterium sp.]